MNPYVLDLNYIKITYYSLFILIGFLSASFLINLEAKKHNINKDFLNNLIFWTMIFGIIGARIYYVIFNLEYYDSYLEMLKIYKGGLAIHGGIIFGIIFIMLYCFKYKVRIFKILDIFVVGLILGQAIGRWGNFFNSEAYGPEVSRIVLYSYKIIPDFVINGMNINGTYYHPTFYYESLYCILGFILLLLIRKIYKYLKIGQLTSLYLIYYGIGRFFIEGFRTDSLYFGNYKVAQIVSIVMILFGTLYFFNELRKSRFENRYDEVEDDIRF